MFIAEKHSDDCDRYDAIELLKVEQVADLLQCSPRNVYRLADAGKMPRPLKIGSLVRWPRGVITEWIEGGCKPVRTVTLRRGR